MTGQFTPPGTGGLSSLLIVRDLVKNAWEPKKSYTVAPPSGSWDELDPEVVAGYTPIGVVGHIAEASTGASTSSGTRCSYCLLYTCFYDPTDGKIKFGYRDVDASTKAKFKLTIKVLYAKSDAIGT